MTDINHVEIYRQRYETFRHLDKLHWQMLHISIAAGAAAAALTTSSFISSIWWPIFGLGVMWSIFGLIMRQIRSGILTNNLHLKNAAELIGDTGIPDNKRGIKSVSTFVSGFIFWVGLGASFLSTFNLLKIYL